MEKNLVEQTISKYWLEKVIKVMNEAAGKSSFFMNTSKYSVGQSHYIDMMLVLILCQFITGQAGRLG